MKWQSLFTGKKKKNICLPSAEFALRVVKLKKNDKKNLC